MVQKAAGSVSQAQTDTPSDGPEQSMPSRSRTLAWSSREELQHAIQAVLHEIRSRSAWGPVWIVCPNRLSARVWERELAAAKGLFNVQVLSEGDLAGYLLGASARPLATPRQVRHSLRSALVEGGVTELAQLDPEGLLPSFARVMERLTGLRLEEIEQLTDVGPDGGGRADLAREVTAVVRRARGNLGGGVRVGSEDVQRAAAVLQQTDVALSTLPKGLEVVWLLADVPRYPVDELLQGLSMVVPCTRLVWHAGEESLDQSLVAAVGSVDAVGSVGSVGPMTAVEHVRSVARTEPSVPGLRVRENDRAQERLQIAPDLQTEAELVVAALVDAAEKGVRWSQMAVLWPKREPYDTLVRVALSERGIPVANGERRSVQESRAGRWLHAMGQYLLEPHRRQRSVRLLHAVASDTSSPDSGRGRGSDSGGSPNTRPVNEWLRIAKRLRLRGGLRDWLRDLGNRDLHQLHTTEQKEAERFRSFLDALNGVLENSAKPWTPWSLQIEHAMDVMLGDAVARAEWPQSEAAAAELIVRSVRGLRDLEPESAVRLEEAGVSASTCFAELDASLAELRVPTTSQEGVHVVGIEEALGACFEVSVVLGMNDGVFPASPPTDVLREAFALPSDTLERDTVRRAFCSVRTLTRSVVWSASRADVALGQELFLSPWILDLASEKENRVVEASELLRGTLPWCTSYVSRHAALGGRLRVLNADHEILATALSHGGEKYGAGIEPYVPTHSRRQLLLQQRASGEMSVFEGVLDPDGDIQMRREDLPKAYSASALQKWATCPMQYWFHSILRVSEEDDIDPEERKEDARDLGTLYHRVLERTLAREQSMLVEGSLVWPRAEDDAAVESLRSMRADLVAEELDRALAEALAVGSLSEGPFLGQVRAAMEGAVVGFLEKERVWRSETGMNPVAFEHSFGRDDRVEVPLAEGGTVALRGFIDRVDRDSRGRIVVTDYKTSEKRNFPGAGTKDPLGFGRNVQLDCYREGLSEFASTVDAMASAVAPPDGRTHDSAPDAALDEEAGHAFAGQYWSVRRPFDRVSYVLDDERRQLFHAYVSKVVAALGDGYFPPTPHDYERESYPSCTRCSYQTVCPPSRVDVAEDLTEKATRFLEITGRKTEEIHEESVQATGSITIEEVAGT